MVREETMRDMEEFREANRAFSSHKWTIDQHLPRRSAYNQKAKWTGDPTPSAASHQPPQRHPMESNSNRRANATRFEDSEMRRQRRVAVYKAYGVESKMKASFRAGFRWVKNKCSSIIYGY